MSDDEAIPTIEQLVDRYTNVLYRYAHRLTGSSVDAEDLVQETFLIAHRKLGQLRSGRAALGWLIQVLRRCRFRQRDRLPIVASVSVEEILDASNQPVGVLDEVEPDRLMALIEQMPDEFREPLLLFYFEELRYREIAEALDCPIGTVMSRLARAKAYLRSRLVPERLADER